MKKYEIFISYRRNPGAESAKHLRDILVQKGYKTFFDTDSLRNGDFNKDLLDVIENCDDFIILLTPGALDRCVNEDDWVRQELACALQHKKNVIPIISAGFTFPEELPPEIEGIRYRNGINANTEYFDAAMAKLMTFLTKKPFKVLLTRRILPIAGIAALTVLAAVGLTSVLNQKDPAPVQVVTVTVPVETTASTEPSVFPATQAEKNILDEAIAYAVNNLSTLNTAMRYFNQTVDEIAQYYGGSVGAPTKKAVLEQIDWAVKMIQQTEKAYTEMSDTLSAQMTDTILPKGDFAILASSFRTDSEEMLNDLNFLKAMLNDPMIPADTGSRVAANRREYSTILGQLQYNCLNFLFAEVDRAAIKQSITTEFPKLTEMYSIGIEWTSDQETLTARENAMLDRMNQNLNDFATMIGDNQHLYDIERSTNEITIDVYGSDHPNAPKKSDTFSELWTKMEYCMGDGPAELIINNLMAMDEKVQTYEEYYAVGAAWIFVDYQYEHGYDSGSIITEFSNGASHPTLQEGDIIVAVNGTPVKSTAEIAKAKKAAGGDSWTFTVLRLVPNENYLEEYAETLNVTVTKDGPTWTARTLEPLHR